MSEILPLILDLPKNHRMRMWQRRSFLAPDGELYVPAATAGNEVRVWMCLLQDGVGFIKDKKHIYAPLSWLEREYPKSKELWDVMRRRLRELQENPPRE